MVIQRQVHHTKAILALDDGSIFHGLSIGAAAHTIGEVVFNTAMTGYQEILTDPSYSRQIVMLTYPHIGNTGVNREDIESERVHAAGLIIRNMPLLASNYRATQSLPEYLQAHGIVAIAGIDTRQLTRHLRETGAQSGAILVAPSSEEQVVQLARSFPGLSGMDLAKVVSTTKAYDWIESEWRHAANGTHDAKQEPSKHHVVAFDFGIKFNILRMLTQRGCKVTVLPAQSSAAEALALKPDGIFLSNGPGDPQPCDYAIAASKELIERGIPTLGICLGHQIMALASGAKTMKMKFGHHGANHPVQDIATGKVMITSQNHGFAVDAASLPDNCRITHVSLFDGSLQGFTRTDQPAFCFQGHPEASPGPSDIGYLFDHFISLIERHKNA
jgi:carbamoyl-phosphate synthase small subunit